MSYDFDTVIDRKNTNSLKWDVTDGELPMWVADMDFRIAPEIQQAIMERAEHGIFGYSVIPQRWRQAYVSWWSSRHSFQMEEDGLIFCSGVIPAISSIVRKLTTPAERVLVQTPAYHNFYTSIENNGRVTLKNELVYDGTNYHMDFDDLERKLADAQTTLMILCNPHNPMGKIWDRETLARIGALCKACHVTVIADEIHCDLTQPGLSYIPFASVNETCKRISITCVAPTKTFNLAGVQSAAVYVPDEVLRHKVWRGLNTDEVAEPNAFAVQAAVAAFEKGMPWLDELRVYVEQNKQRVYDFLAGEELLLKAVPSQATYLLWIDCSRIAADASALIEFLRRTTGLFVSPGAEFGQGGAAFFRLNVACPHSVLEDGLQRLAAGVREYMKSVK